MTTVHHIPDNLLLRIFELVEQYEIVLELKLVCRRWNRLINDVGLSNRRLVLKRFPGTWGSFAACKRKLKLIIGHFPKLVRLDFDNFYSPISIFDSPNQQIEYVTFTLSGVKPPDLLAFVRMCPNIRILGIYYEFHLNDRCLVETIRMLKKLESFEIDAAFRFDLRGRFFNSFENLKRLYVDLGQPIIQTLLNNLVERNGSTLTSLALKPVEYRYLKTIGNSLKNLTELRILRLQRFRAPSNDSLDFSGLSNLTLLHINSWNQRDHEGLLELVERLLAASKTLRDLKVPSCPLNSRTLLETIARLCSDLRVLTLINPKITDEDCRLFGAFTHLKSLTITGASHNVTSQGRDIIIQACPLLHPRRMLFSHQREISLMTINQRGSYSQGSSRIDYREFYQEAVAHHRRRSR